MKPYLGSLIGTAIGAGIGLLLDSVTTVRSTSETQEITLRLWAVGAFIGGLIGFGVHWLWAQYVNRRHLELFREIGPALVRSGYAEKCPEFPCEGIRLLVDPGAEGPWKQCPRCGKARVLDSVLSAEP